MMIKRDKKGLFVHYMDLVVTPKTWCLKKRPEFARVEGCKWLHQNCLHPSMDVNMEQTFKVRSFKVDFGVYLLFSYTPCTSNVHSAQHAQESRAPAPLALVELRLRSRAIVGACLATPTWVILQLTRLAHRRQVFPREHFHTSQTQELQLPCLQSNERLHSNQFNSS